MALAELSLGVLALIPRTRKLAAVAAFGVHAGILLILSPLGRDYNHAVWPWNVALAMAGFALIARWKETPLRSLARCHRLVRPLIVLLVIAPAGFYVAVTDAYLAHNVYSFNIPRVVWCSGAGRCTDDPQSLATMRAFNVPMPPEHRLIEAYFRRTCRPGDRITIRDTRWWAARQGFDHRELACPAGS
jgi:hypothetical protein